MCCHSLKNCKSTIDLALQKLIVAFCTEFMHSEAGLHITDLLIQKSLLSNTVLEDLSVKRNPSKEQNLKQSPALQMNNCFLSSLAGFFSLLFAARYYLFQQRMSLFVLIRWTDLWGLSLVYLVQLSVS